MICYEARVQRFRGDINACREFLRDLGLECTHRGWEGNGLIGIIEFYNGEHHAAAWDSEPERSVGSTDWWRKHEEEARKYFGITV